MAPTRRSGLGKNPEVDDLVSLFGKASIDIPMKKIKTKTVKPKIILSEDDMFANMFGNLKVTKLKTARRKHRSAFSRKKTHKTPSRKVELVAIDEEMEGGRRRRRIAKRRSRAMKH
jgi:hypothetical protein